MAKATAVFRAAPDCPTGTHSLRVRTRTGVTDLKLISVGALNEVDEVEPNNRPGEAQEVAPVRPSMALSPPRTSITSR